MSLRVEEVSRQKDQFACQKDQLASLQREKEELAHQKDQLSKQVQNLSSLQYLGKAEAMQLIRHRNSLEKEVKQLRKTAHLGTIAGAPAPAYWMDQSMTAPPAKFLWPEGKKAIFDLIQRTAVHSACTGRDGTFVARSVRSVRVWWIENPILWKQYCNKATEIASRHALHEGAGSARKLAPVQPPVGELFFDTESDSELDFLPPRLRRDSLNEELNEVFLWHGTTQARVNAITQEGFDERLSNLGGMLGAGLYFAEDSCKSGQYAEKSIASSRSHFFALSRVLLGKPHHSKVPIPDIRRAPDGCDSVVFTPDHDRGCGHHREFVVYDRFQAYPEFIVEARTA
jgi:hypothetical protein